MDTDQVGNNTEGRQCDDVHLGVTEEPEQVLEQQRVAADMLRLTTHRHNGGHEEAGAQQHVQGHHDGADKQGREGKQGQYGRGEYAPDGQRHAHQGHAPGARLQDGDHIVQAAHGETNDKYRQGRQHQQDAGLGTRCTRQDGLGWIQGPSRSRRAAADKKAGSQQQDGGEVHPKTDHVQPGEDHVPGAYHEWNQVVTKAAQKQGSE